MEVLTYHLLYILYSYLSCCGLNKVLHHPLSKVEIYLFLIKGGLGEQGDQCSLKLTNIALNVICNVFNYVLRYFKTFLTHLDLQYLLAGLEVWCLYIGI